MKKYVLKRDPNALPERLTRYKGELNEEQFRVVTKRLSRVVDREEGGR